MKTKPSRSPGCLNFKINEKGIRIYTPPSPGKTPKLIKELVTWVNSKEAKDTYSVIVSAIIHYQFVSIHPFTDGNGRLARLLGLWILYQRDFDIRHIFSLDEYFANNRKLYYQKIQQARKLVEVKSSSRILLSHRQEEILRTLRDRSPIKKDKAGQRGIGCHNFQR